MDLVNIIYRYANRFINSFELVELLMNLDKTAFSEDEVREIEILVEEVKETIATTPIEIDRTEMRRIASLDRIAGTLERAKANDNNNEEAKADIETIYNDLIRKEEKSRDSGPRYEELYELLTNNAVFVDRYRKMSDTELLKLITQYIFTPIVPNINQETFDNLVSIGIGKDQREALWRLAFNYNRKGMDFARIEKHFIKKRDDDYLMELVSAVGEDLDINKLIEKIINTEDVDFIANCINRARAMGVFTGEIIKKLEKVVSRKPEINNKSSS